MIQSPSYLRKISCILLYLIAVAVSVKSFREPDLWWQIRTGQWILQHHSVPHQDMFSYTMAGAEWINIKWGFEVLAALVSNMAGPEAIFILQAIVNCLLVFFLLKLSTIFIQKTVANNISERLPALGDGGTFIFATAVSLIVFFIGSDYRMIGRPEMVSHLMTVVFLFILEKYRQSSSKQIYWLIPLQMLWANMHEAYGIGIVILAIYTFSALVQEQWNKNAEGEGKNRSFFKLLLVMVASAAAIIVNPNGIKLITRPLNILSQVYENKYTTELLSFTSYGWWKKEAWIGILFFLASIAMIFLIKIGGASVAKQSPSTKQRKAPFFLKRLQRLSDGYTIVILAFLYLGLTAYRNLIFLSIVCFPVFNSTLLLLLQKWEVRNKSIKYKSFYSYFVPVVLLFSFYALIVSNKYYELTKSHDRFGAEVLSNFNPVGAADFIASSHLSDKKCFSDYLTSSYLLWKLQPDFKTFIDLRDLDVFPKEHFDKFFTAANFPRDFHSLDSVEHFDYVVLYQSRFAPLHSYLYNDSIYALKYVDAVAAVYQKTDSFIKADIFSNCQPVAAGVFATIINKTLNPFYHPYDYSSIDNDYFAACYYINISRFDLAINRAQRLAGLNSSSDANMTSANLPTAYKGYELLGQIYQRYARVDPLEEKRKQYLDNSEQFFMESLKLKKDYAPTLLGLATICYEKEDYFGALKNADKCLAVDNKNLDAHILSAECYKVMLNKNTNPANQNKYTMEMLNHYFEANSINPGNASIEANIGFCYFRLNDCKRVKDYLLPVANNKTLNDKESSAVKECLKQCGF